METFWWLEKLTVPAVLTIRPLSNWYKSVLNEWLCPSCGCNHTLSPTVCPYPWLLLQRLLLEMILLVLVADQSQSLTWVMAMLSTVLSSAALPWWQKERVPACQRKGSAESWRVTESLTFLSVWLTAPPFIDTETHTHRHNDRLAMKGFHVFCWVTLSMFPYLLLSVNLKILPFFLFSNIPLLCVWIQISGAAIQSFWGSSISANLLPHSSRQWSSLTLL